VVIGCPLYLPNGTTIGEISGSIFYGIKKIFNIFLNNDKKKEKKFYKKKNIKRKEIKQKKKNKKK
jgi:hypothetical protein